MMRALLVAFFLSGFVVCAWAQTAPEAKPIADKPAPTAKATAKSTKPAESGPCQIGVIPIAGNLFLV